MARAALCLTIWALAVPALFGCGTAGDTGVASRQHDDEPFTPPDGGAAGRGAAPLSAEALHGAWRWDYVTAGALQRRLVLEFEPGGTLTLTERSMFSFTEPAETSTDRGFFEVTPENTVRYGWGQGVVTEAEHSLTFLDNPDLIDSHPCCRLTPLPARYWTHRGYVARDHERTRFERITMNRVIEEDGSIRSSLRTYTELVFSAPPAQLTAGDECSLQVRTQVDVTEASIQELVEHQLTLPCRVQVDGVVKVVTMPGLDTSEGRPLLERPHYARTVWRGLLEEEQSAAGWSVTIVRALTDAFEPYLAFDPALPDVLFHHLDANGSVVWGYGLVDPP